MSVPLSTAYQAYTVACDNLKDAMAEEKRVKSLEYFRSEQRPIDEAKREKIKSVVEQMTNCCKKDGVMPGRSELLKWAAILYEI